MIVFQTTQQFPENLDRVDPPFLSVEDGGAAMFFKVCDDEEDTGMFVRIHSWDDQEPVPGWQNHPRFRELLGKKVRVTIEIMD